MKTFILFFLIAFLSSCSFLPRFTFDTPNSVPQSVDKSKVKEVCKGKAEWDELGNIKSCSKGYYRYNEGYNKQERRMTIVERVQSFFNTILGWGIPGLIVICILFPGAFTVIGAIIGRLFEGAYGAGVQTLKRVAKAIQKTRKEGKDINQSLEAELDTENKKYIAKIKEQENIK